jgi:hypothetical protein
VSDSFWLFTRGRGGCGRHPELHQPGDPPHEVEVTAQARPNVLFEAGMAMGAHPDRTVTVEIGTLRPFSDLGGRHVVRLPNATQDRQDLAQRSSGALCLVNLTSTRWHTLGDFQHQHRGVGFGWTPETTDRVPINGRALKDLAWTSVRLAHLGIDRNCVDGTIVRFVDLAVAVKVPQLVFSERGRHRPVRAAAVLQPIPGVDLVSGARR